MCLDFRLRHLPQHTCLYQEKCVAILQRRQPMRDNKRCASKCKPIHRINDRGFGLEIDGTRRLVEDENGCILQESARKSDALALSARKTHAAFTDDVLVALGYLNDKLMDVGGFRRP